MEDTYSEFYPFAKVRYSDSDTTGMVVRPYDDKAGSFSFTTNYRANERNWVIRWNIDPPSARYQVYPESLLTLDDLPMVEILNDF